MLDREDVSCPAVASGLALWPSGPLPQTLRRRGTDPSAVRTGSSQELGAICRAADPLPCLGRPLRTLCRLLAPRGHPRARAFSPRTIDRLPIPQRTLGRPIAPPPRPPPEPSGACEAGSEAQPSERGKPWAPDTARNGALATLLP